MPLVRGSWAAFDGIADWIGADMAKGLEGVAHWEQVQMGCASVSNGDVGSSELLEVYYLTTKVRVGRAWSGEELRAHGCGAETAPVGARKRQWRSSWSPARLAAQVGLVLRK